MKKMRKFLGFLLLVALTVSSVAVISIAASTRYDGDLSVAKGKLDAAVIGTEKAQIKLLRDVGDQSILLAEVYQYLQDTPVNPAESGYSEFIAQYNETTFRVAYVLYQNYLGANSAEKEEAALISLLKHMAGAPIIDGDRPANPEIVIGYKCPTCSKEVLLKTDSKITVSDTTSGKESVGSRVVSNNIFTNSGAVGVTRPLDCSCTEALTAIAYKYSDFEVLVNALNFEAYSVLDSLVTKLMDVSETGSINYYDYLASIKAVKGIIESVGELSYEETFNSQLYTGKLDEFSSKVEKLDEKKSLEVLAEGLADIYTYLKEKPVDPTTDKYYEVYLRYEALCDSFVEKWINRIDSASAETDVDGNADVIAEGSKLALLMELRAYLVETPLSEKVVNAYNTKRQSLIQDYDGFYAFIENETALAPLEPVVNADVPEFTARLEALETADTLDARKTAFAELYAFVVANDISASETELISRYKNERNSLADDLIATVSDAISVSDKVAALESVRAYLAVTPISKNTVDRYNEIRENTITLCTNFIECVNAEGFIPVYEPLDEPVVTANEAAMMSFLEALETALNNYETANAENKATALENAKNSAKDMYAYLKACMPDTSASYYSDFITRYSAARTELVREMIAIAEAEGTEAAFKTVRDYLNLYPLTKALVDEYNAKVDEVFASEENLKTSLKASCVYHVIDTVVQGINSEATTKNTLYSNMRSLSEYYLMKLDVTDEAYNEFKTVVFVNAESTFADAIAAHIDAKTSTGDIAAELTELSEFLKSVYVNESTVTNLVINVFSEKITAYSTQLDALTDGSVETAALVTDYDDIAELIDTFNKTEGYEERKAAFTVLYNRVSEADTTVITSTDEDYVALMELYSVACASMEAELLGYIDSFEALVEKTLAFADARGFVEANKFSNGVVNGYNTKLNEMKAVGYGSEKTKLEEKAATLEYAPVTTATVNFADLEVALSDGVNAAELSYMYHLLATGEKTTEGETDTYKAFDFGSSIYATVLAGFNAAKTSVMEAFLQEWSAVSDPEAAREKLLEIEAYFLKDEADDTDKSNIFSLYMVNAYNDMRNQTLIPLTEEFVAKHELYTPILDEIDVYLQIINEETLTDAQKTRVAEIISTYRPAFRYAYIDGELIAIDNIVKVKNVYTDNKTTAEVETLNSDLSLIYKRTAMDKLSRYISKNIEKNSVYRGFDEKTFVEAAYKGAFLEILDMIDALTGEAKTTELATWTQYAEDSCLPEELVAVFNERFETSIVYTAPAAATDSGTVIGFFEAYNTFKVATSLDDMKTLFADLTAYLNACPVSSNKPYDVYFAASSGASGDYEDGGMEEEKTTPITEMQVKLATLLMEQKDALESQTPLSQYELGYEKDTNGSIKTKDKFYYDGKKAYVYSLASGGANSGVVDTNGYTTVNGANTGGYFNLTAQSNNDSIVYEFDLMFPENNGAAQNFMLSSSLQYFYVTDYCLTGGNVFSLPKDAEVIEFVPGAWKHVILIINTEEKTMELLVDYITVGKTYVENLIRPDVYDYSNAYSRATTFVRLNHMNSDASKLYDNHFCYDNIEVYDGNAYRNVDRFTTMRDTKKFQTYVDYFTNESYEAPDRLYAYYQAKEIYDSVKKNQSLKKYVERYDNFDYVSKIEAPARAYHMNKIRAMYEEISASSITTSNAEAQQKRITELQAYVDNNLIYLDANDTELMTVRNALVDYQNQINLTSYVDDLALAISRFYRAPTLVAMNRHVESIVKYMELTQVADGDNEERILQDKAIIDVIGPIGSNKAVQELLAGEPLTISSFYDVYVPWRLAEQTRIENSLKILDCMSFIESLVDDDTLSGSAYESALVNKAAEEANYDFVESYMAVIRRIRSSGEYVSDADVERALHLADLIDAKFYVNLQTKHLSVLKEYIEKYSLTNSYIERLGVCMYLESYIAENDIDFSNPEALLYKNTLATYKDEVQQYLVDYEKLLESNTVAFVGIVREMGTYTSYSQIKPLYDKALTSYYYAMNTDTEEAKEAVILFNEYGDKLKTLEENGAMFVGYSKNFNSKRQAQRYRALVNATKCVEAGIDEGVEGVGAALKSYNEAMAQYNSTVEAVNEEISEITDVLSAVRSNSIASTVLAIIKRIFN